MKLNHKWGTVLWRLVQAGVIFLTLLGYVKGIFVSLDIDESYAVAQSYRMAMGERLFADMWESHQLSAFLSAVFIRLYLIMFQTTDYLVIYLRVVGMLIHMGIGYGLYRCVKKAFGNHIAFILSVLHLNFFPKWVQMPEFELMHYWFLLLIFLLMHSYFTGEKSSWWKPMLSGVCLVGSMLCYPTMILLYPVYLAGFIVLERIKNGATGGRRLRSSFWLTVGAGGSGGAFLLYLFSYQTWEEFITNISYVFMDESHTTYTMAEKWEMYAEQAVVMAGVYWEKLLASIGIVAVVLIVWVTKCILQKKALLVGNMGKRAEYIILSILLLTAVLLQKDYMVGCLMQDENQFYLQVRYVAAMIPALYLGIRYFQKAAVYLWLCVLPALMALPAALFITNMNVNVTCSRIVLGIWGSLLMLFIYFQSEVRDSESGLGAKVGMVLTYGLGFGLLVGFFVCRLVMIRVTGCLPVTIKAPMERMEYGPEKGIYILEEQARVWNNNYSILQDMIEEEDKLLFIGAENLIYPAMECILSTPSTQGTTIFNEMFIRYYEEHPDKLPTVVVFDKTFGTNPVYRLFSDTQIVTDWLFEKYPDAVAQETDYMTILFLEE